MVLLSIAVGVAADNKARFAPGPAASYPNHQTLDKITIAAIPYITEDQLHSAFDKTNPQKYGVLPVLLVIDNGTGKALRLDLEAQYIDVDNRKIDATPLDDVLYVGGSGKAPRMPGTSPNPLPFPHRAKHGPLNTPEISGHAFAAKMLPIGDSASGFIYFQTDFHPGSRFYVNGLKDAATGKEYFYFDLPLDQK